MKKYWRSRLAKKEERRNFRLAIFYVALSLLLVFGAIFLGIPILIKIAIFLGNIRGSYSPVESSDKLAPSPPTLMPFFEATNSAQINLKGFAEPSSSVEIFVSGISSQKVVAENDGLFLITNLKLTSGLNEIYAKATDRAGNTSQSSALLNVVFDNTSPKLTVSQPADNFHFPNNQKSVDIKGETEEDSFVSINNHLAIMSPEGKFTYLFSLSEGENKISVWAIDKAGNKTTQELTLWRE